MRSSTLILASLCLATAAFAKQPKIYQSGEVVEMESAPCQEANRKAARAPQCAEYVVQTDRVTYHVRSKSVKQPSTLPVGERALFRMEKGEFISRATEEEGKELEFVVISISPRSESTADASPVHLNHLQ